MNKREFIDRLLVKFMSRADKDNANITVQDMEKFLTEDYDFEKMYETVMNQWSKSSMPSIAWLKENCKYKEAPTKVYWTLKCEKWGFPYEFEISMREGVAETVQRYKKKGFKYIDNNKIEIEVTYGI